MGVKELSRVKNQGKTITLNLKNDAKFAFNLIFEGDLIKSSSSWIESDITLPTDEENQPLGVIKTYLLDGVKYCYCSDNRLYKEENGVFNLFSEKTFNSIPHLLTVLEEGERRTLIISDNASVLRGYGEVDVTVPYTSCYQVCNGILFVAEDNTIKFGEPFNFETFSVDLNPKRIIKLDAELGEIVSLIAMETDLKIVCKHAIMSLSTFGNPEQYELKRYSLPYVDIQKNSVRKIGNGIYFISQGKLCCLRKQKFDFIDLVFETGISSIGQASDYNGYYLLPVNAFGKDALYVKNTNTGTEWFTHLPRALSSVGGIGISSKTNKLCTLSFGSERHFECEYIAREIFTGKAGYLQEICLETTAEITLEIESDFEKIKLACAKGKNKFILSYKTQKFSLAIMKDGGSVEIKNLSVTIR